MFAAVISNAQDCSEIFISEYVEGSNNNKAIELYNPTDSPIDLQAGHYRMGRERNGNGIPMFMDITGIIAPHDVRVFVIDQRDPDGTGTDIPVDIELQEKADTFINPIYVESNSPMYFNGNDSFVLGKGTGEIPAVIDIVGRLGEDPGDGAGWWVPGDPFTRYWTKDQTLVRKPTILHGRTDFLAVFDPSVEWDSLPNNTFDSLGTHACLCGIVGVNEYVYDNTFTVYPNPIESGDLMIRTSAEVAAYTVFNSNGTILKRAEGLGKKTFYSLNLPDVASGMYFIEVEFANGSRSVQKLLAR